jgi:hypothetical protein
MKRTINNWEPEVKSLLDTLTKHGCTIIRGNNGADRFNRADLSEAEFIENLIACDEAWLYVAVPALETGGKQRCLYLVLGNAPGELVCDYCVDPTLDKVTEEHYAKWDGKSQPTKEVESNY